MLPLWKGNCFLCLGHVGLALALGLGSVAPLAAQTPPASAAAQTPPTSGAPAAAPAARTRTAPDRFEILAIDVAGVTRLTPGDVERLVYPFTGPNRGTDDVEAARKAVQDAYAARGYEAVIVEIPQQEAELFEQGVVTLRVSEVPVGRVRVVDSRYHSPAVVRAQVPSLKEGEPLDLKALQTEIADASRFPDRVVTPSFRPGAVPGTVEVDLKVDSKRPLHGSLELNNDNSPSTSDLRLTAGLRYTNLWQAGHSLALTYAVAPRKRSESEVFSASYTAPLIGSPWTLLAYGYTSNSNIAALGGTNVLGNGYQLGVRGIYRLPGDQLFQTIAFGPDFKNFDQDIFVEGVSVGEAPIRYIPFVVEYSLAKESEFSSIDLTLGATMGLRLIKRTICVEIVAGQPCVPVDQFRNREIDSNENFKRANFEVNGTFANARDFAVAARLSGQIADSHLVTNEQFAIGGLTSVRGYFLSESVGDNGLAGSVELRLPDFASTFGSFMNELRVFGFGDAGVVRTLGALPDQKASFSLVGAGAGVRVRLFDLFTGEFVLAVPLKDGPVTEQGDLRASFLARGEF
jgi:hemolysin activation/secretion protein